MPISELLRLPKPEPIPMVFRKLDLPIEAPLQSIEIPVADAEIFEGSPHRATGPSTKNLVSIEAQHKNRRMQEVEIPSLFVNSNYNLGASVKVDIAYFQTPRFGQLSAINGYSSPSLPYRKASFKRTSYRTPAKIKGAAKVGGSARDALKTQVHKIMSTIEFERYDYLVIGSGLAGLSFALEVAKTGTVCVLTKSAITESNTSWAQGGIAAAIGEADNWELHEHDTLVAGAGLCDPDAVRHLVKNAPAAIDWLTEVGVRFDAEPNGDLDLGMEGGHSRHRIVHHRDKTGWEVERAISEAVRSNPKIRVYDHAFVTSLLIANGRCVGAAAEIDGIGSRNMLARAVLLASGGCGRMYSHSTNPSVATADGIALAVAIGAELKNMEFMQFHPTTLYHQKLRSFLISEAVRGAGGTLRNHLGRRFMYDYDSRLELAPRDIVARAIEAEIRKQDTWCVYLDTTHLPADRLRAEFPTIDERLRGIGIEMEKEWIPVVPAQHYSCGGVVTDLQARTSVPGLYASGEVACTGVHGANRLASNSLLEALVFSRSAAEVVTQEPPLPDNIQPSRPVGVYLKAIAEADAVRIRRALQHTMTQHVAIVRSDAGLQLASEKIDELITSFDNAPDAPYSTYSFETRNLLVAASEVVKGAQKRRENVGLHYNVNLTDSAPDSFLSPAPPPSG